MAVASWMLGKRNIRSNRFNRSQRDADEDNIKLDLQRDPHENAREILIELNKTSGLSEGKRLNYLNAFVKLTLHVNGNLAVLGYTTEEILYCLRVCVVNDLTQVRCGGFRAIRHVLTSENDIIFFNKLLFPFLIARSLDLILKNDVERIEAIKLIRKLLFLSPSNFSHIMSRSLVSLANGGIEEKDRMLRVCLATLSELCVLNSDVFILSGGVAAITRNLLECQTPKIAESLCGVLLLLLDRPITRNYAAVDLHCVAAPYCDFHYRHGWMDKNRDERELRFNCSRLALLSILRSWPGILHFCSPSDATGFKAIVDILHLNQLEVRKAVLDLLYELLGLPQPEWTDELSVALSAIDPAEPQASWRLNEGFVVAEGRSVLPHLARTTPSISDMHLSLLLYCFLENGLLGALAEVIVTSDTFISVRATVLLGELLRLIQIMLPPECCNISPALPNLLEYAVMNKPQALRAIAALQQLHKLLKRRPASYSLYLDYILQSGNFIKKSSKMEFNKKYKMSHIKSKFTQLVLKDGDEELRNTGVLISKDPLTWNWNLIKVIIRDEIDIKLDTTEALHRNFIKTLVGFYKPSNNRYSHMDLSTPKSTQGYTIVGIDLIYCLQRLEDAFCTKLLFELFMDIAHNINAITTSKSSHDCLFSPQHMANTQCQTYFLFIGRLGSSREGIEILNNIKIFEQLEHLATTTNHLCYVKLIVSSLDYKEASPARNLLSAILTCPNESSRLYATQFLLVLLRSGQPHFSNWGIKLLATQLKDKSRTIYLSTLSTLHEACEVPICVENLVKLNPDLLHLGEKGVLLLIRFLSVTSGFNMLNKNDFVLNEIKRWDQQFNFRYVRLVEGETSDALTLHQRGEDGRYDKRTSSSRSTSRKELFLPPHIYGQLTKTNDGFQMLCQHGSISNFIQCIENGICETEQDILNVKASLWALGHLGSSSKGSEYLNSKNILASMVALAENCVVYSIRATAFYALGLVATTRIGADSLFKLHWVCTRHDRHDRWPIIEEENWQDEKIDEPIIIGAISSDSERTSSDKNCGCDFLIEDADSSTTDDDILFMGDSVYSFDQKKSSTLPNNQSSSSVQHKRSLSESKTFELIRGHDQRHRLTAEMPQRHRDNSVTDSTTSGVSSCDSVLGKSAINERVQTLSPIPSSSSLVTLKKGVKLRRNSESSRRVSMHSITPSDRSTVSPAGSSSGKLSYQDLLGYATIRNIRRPLKSSDEELSESSFIGRKSKIQSMDTQRRFQYSYYMDEAGYFGNYLFGGLSLSSLSSVQKFSIKDVKKTKGQCYMGICLPLVLTNLFPDCQVTATRLSYSDKNLLQTDSDNEISEESSPKKRNKFAKHDTKTCFSCSQIRDKFKLSDTNKKGTSHLSFINSCSVPSAGTSLASGDSITNNNESDTAIKCDILKHIERLANPVLIKQAKQSLLQHKQKQPHLFQDICLYSEVCKMVSEYSYRLGPRRLLQELFLDVNFESLHKEPTFILSQDRKVHNEVMDQSKSETSKKDYSLLAMEQRKFELSNKLKLSVDISNRTVKRGFSIDSQCTSEEKGLEQFSPVKYEPRSPPLPIVTEENIASTENLLIDCPIYNESTTATTTTNKTETKPVSSLTIKALDELKFTYNENKFPIKNREDAKNVIK